MFLAHKAMRDAIRRITSSICVAPARLMENGHAVEMVENMVWAWNWLAFFFFSFTVLSSNL